MEKYHRDTLKLVVERVNSLIAEQEEARRNQAEAELERVERHKGTVKDFANRLKFD